MVALYFWGSRMQKRQASQREMIEANKQSVSLLVIDKKKLKLKEANLPGQAQIEAQTPWYMKRAKMPVVKVKIGPRVVNMIAEPEVYDILPVKQEVRAAISGIYILEVKGIRGNLIPKPRKKKWYERFQFWKKDKE
ncbi:MAG: hypothetical protein IJL66_09415 [Lachnospiraceae bacterium]|nr:hypothetical protein [Lachnospiraceae bacterium]